MIKKSYVEEYCRLGNSRDETAQSVGMHQQIGTHIDFISLKIIWYDEKLTCIKRFIHERGCLESKQFILRVLFKTTPFERTPEVSLSSQHPLRESAVIQLDVDNLPILAVDCSMDYLLDTDSNFHNMHEAKISSEFDEPDIQRWELLIRVLIVVFLASFLPYYLCLWADFLDERCIGKMRLYRPHGGCFGKSM
ncbi:hypothetical protein RF11_00181 [Thelohanellus kitauei]|uniref:Uncharacterized protein n=1 Tax=Thelohanellus kitauei TaxID=669202 RepID=A0A0C2MSX8_THEKT|nr:hypothetical protein RF11_00181 [Thelohanellus kitauei]